MSNQFCKFDDIFRAAIKSMYCCQNRSDV